MADRPDTCDRFLETASARLDGEATDREARALDDHLRACPPCARRVAAITDQRRRLRLHAASPVPDLTASILAAVPPATARSRRSPIRLAVAGGLATAGLVAATLVVVGLWGGDGPAPPPQVAVRDAWARPGRAGGVTAIYAYVGNDGGADRVVAASTPVAERAEFHVVEQHDGLLLMRSVTSVPLPPEGGASFEPGGAHVMLVGLRQDLEPGQTVPLTLVLERAGRVELAVTVSDAAASSS